MFQEVIEKQFGHHHVFRFDTERHPFLPLFQAIFKTTQLDQLDCSGLDTTQDVSDLESEAHKLFYRHIKAHPEFRHLYCNLIRDIYSYFFPDEVFFIYQSYPSIRIQYFNNVVVPPHYDSDAIGCHPLGERNFILPITSMFGTNTIFIESEPGKKDFKGIPLEYGELFSFNGNRCTHYNEKNQEGRIRISLDFRVLLVSDYLRYINGPKITMTNPRDPEQSRVPVKMTIANYYQLFDKHGSEPMTEWHYQSALIVQSRPNFDRLEADACFEYLKDGTNFITEFKQTDVLEKTLAAYLDTDHCVMTTSGHMAIYLALLALGIGPGTEVIVPDYTMIATLNAVVMTGATPVLVDVSSDTFTLSLELLMAKMTPKTKAVIHVSLNNRQCSLGAIADYCRSQGIFLIEDAAQSLGSRLPTGVSLGTIGDIGCFSLSTPKIISTGQGGFCVTRSAELAARMRMIKNFGRRSSGLDHFEAFGVNLKFTDLQAVIGLEQVKKLPGRIERMKEMYQKYYQALSPLCQMIPPESSNWIPWFVDIYLPPTVSRQSLMDFLLVHNVQTRATYPAIHSTPIEDVPVIVENRAQSFPAAQHVSARGLFLPSHTLLTDDDIGYVCKLIKFYMQTCSSS